MGVHAPLIVGRDGLRGRLETPRDDRGRAIVRLEGGERFAIPTSSLEALPDRSGYSIALGPADVERARAAVQPVTIPVLQEELHVGKRVEEVGRVRLRKRVQERTQTIEHPVLRERVSVDRVPVNQYVGSPPPVRTEGDVLVVPVVEEVIVFEKRLVLREELRISKRAVEEIATQDVVVRSESVDVEHIDAPPTR